MEARHTEAKTMKHGEQRLPAGIRQFSVHTSGAGDAAGYVARIMYDSKAPPMALLAALRRQGYKGKPVLQGTVLVRAHWVVLEMGAGDADPCGHGLRRVCAQFGLPFEVEGTTP